MPEEQRKSSQNTDSRQDESSFALADRLLDSIDAAAMKAVRAEGVAIVDILEPLGLSESLLAAARLAPACQAGLLEEPPEKLAELINGLLQLREFSLAPDWRPGEALATEQSDALRRMLLSIVSDVRLVVVRIALQLYRLREAKPSKNSRPESADRRRQLAIETQEIYAPLANRLGIWQLKWELEDLAFRFLEPTTYKQIATALNEKRQERESFIAEVRTTIQSALTAAGISANISGRPKHIYSIWKKMQQKNRRLDEIYDIRAVRILVNDVSECYAVLGLIHGLWPSLPGEFDDYIANPKENNYRSLHTGVTGPDGRTLEVQVRTHEMHRHAELGVAAHWRYKEGAAAASGFDRKIQLLRQIIEPGEIGGEKAAGRELLEQVRGDAFNDRVYAVTPRGDVVDLPAGATPLDFAYHVHTQIGHRCRGAKVNGRIVPLTYQIQNADSIEIVTGKQAQPSRDWLSPHLGYLAASRSRSKVRNWFRARNRDQNLRQGREVVERELGRLNATDLTAEQIAKQLRTGDSDAMYVAIGAGDISSASVASAVANILQPDAKPVSKRRRGSTAAATKTDIAINGVGDLLYKLARCCRPLSPEPVAGYITLGQGVSIHRQNCGNLLSLQSKNPERVIPVEWNHSSEALYPAKLSVHAYDRTGLLRDVSTVLTDEKVGVESLTTKVNKRSLQAEIDIALTVPGLPALSQVIARLEQLANVTSVRRQN